MGGLKMGRTRKRFSKEFKAKVAFEALKGEKTMTELSSEFSARATQIAKWKKELSDGIPGIFTSKGDPEEKGKDKLIEDLYKRIGQIEVENNWLKKTTLLSVDDRKRLLDGTEKNMSFRKQCELLNISRAGLYYEPKGEAAYNLELMNMIDKEYTDHPDMGVPSMTAYLRNTGKKCGPKRVRRLMRLMGLEAIYPKPRTSIPNKQHKVYPYLLKDVAVTRPNQVWSTDITYIRLKYGNVYIKGYETVPEAAAGLKEYFEYYNERRSHSSLGDKCPDMIYYGKSYQNIHKERKDYYCCILFLVKTGQRLGRGSVKRKDPMYTKKLGKKIKLARIELDLNQTQLADKIGAKQKSISRYETGLAMPSIETLIKMAKELKKPAGYFLEG
ncbi:MAG: IS3 family transposase [Candidatus Omnitrophota bacterium]